ncbi:MAG: 50S ribosomal protein L18 [Myxococcales bacterium]|nr:50S ribosomal protein L18 [Myxococcales bacterium]
MAADRKRNATRIRRKYSIRKRISGTQARPRLSVFRSSKHIYAQLIDDTTGETLVSASTQSPEIREELNGKGKTERASLVGQLIAKKSVAKEITSVIFDRNGFIYHGRVKAVAEAAREGGLVF